MYTFSQLAWQSDFLRLTLSSFVLCFPSNHVETGPCELYDVCAQASFQSRWLMSHVVSGWDFNFRFCLCLITWCSNFRLRFQIQYRLLIHIFVTWSYVSYTRIHIRREFVNVELQLILYHDHSGALSSSHVSCLLPEFPGLLFTHQ
jgi:hypothetical protein